MSGVYQIYNPITEKRYIGSSIDVENRLKQHLRNLKTGKHHNQHLQNAWNKYKDHLAFEPLEYCEPDECLILEQKYIDFYNSSDRQYGYNIDPQAASSGKHLAEETKQKLRAQRLGKKAKPETVEKIRQVNLGKKKPKQSETMKRKYKEGYSIPRFSDVSEEKQEIWRKHLSQSARKRYQNMNNRPEGFYIKCLFSEDIKYYPSLREAARQLNIDKSAITYALRRKQGYVEKINGTFILIDKQEYIQNVELN